GALDRNRQRRESRSIGRSSLQSPRVPVRAGSVIVAQEENQVSRLSDWAAPDPGPWSHGSPEMRRHRPLLPASGTQARAGSSRSDVSRTVSANSVLGSFASYFDGVHPGVVVRPALSPISRACCCNHLGSQPLIIKVLQAWTGDLF